MIRDEIGDILGIFIQEGRWEAYVTPLDREGKFTRKTIISILMALCQAFERHEEVQADLKQRMDGLSSVIASLERTNNLYEKKIGVLEDLVREHENAIKSKAKTKTNL